MGVISTGVASVLTWMGVGAETAATVGAVTAGSAAIAGGIGTYNAMTKDITQTTPHTVMGPQSELGKDRTDDEEIKLGSDRAKDGGRGRSTGRNSLMAPQTTPNSKKAVKKGTGGLRV